MSAALSPNPTAATMQPPIASTTPITSNRMADIIHWRVVNDDNLMPAASTLHATVISAKANLHQRQQNCSLRTVPLLNIQIWLALSPAGSAEGRT